MFCFTCGTEFKSRKNRPGDIGVCSKDCITSQYRQAQKDMIILKRGYPAGYKSKEHYEGSLPKIIECVICNSEFLSIKNKKTCSPVCTETLRMKKILSTRMERYGTLGPNQEAVKRTSQRKYGTDHPTQAKCVKDKAKKTSLERYGFDNPSKSPEIIEKIAQVHLKKFGVRNIYQRKDIMDSAYEKAFGEGITNPMQVPEIYQKAFETKKGRYVLMGAVPLESTKKTCLERYNNEFYFGSSQGKMTRENLISNHGYKDEDVDKIFKSKALSLERIRSKCGTDEEAISIYQSICKSYDSSSHDWALSVADGNEDLASEIYINRVIDKRVKFGEASKLSLKLFIKLEKWLHEKYPDRLTIFVGDKTRKEWFIRNKEKQKIYFYDFTIFDKNSEIKIIVEFNGAYYHPRTEEQNPAAFSKDLEKRKLAEQSGFQFYVVWDDDKQVSNLIFLQEEISKWIK